MAPRDARKSVRGAQRFCFRSTNPKWSLPVHEKQNCQVKLTDVPAPHPLHLPKQFRIYNVILSHSPQRQQQVHLCFSLLG